MNPPSSKPLSQRPDGLLSAVCVATIVIGLYVDQTFARPWGQWSVVFAVALVFGWVLVRFWRGQSNQKQSGWNAIRPLLLCLVLATLGEIFFCQVWGLYTYRQDNLPLFVPPGHVLLYLLGVQCAAWIEQNAVLRRYVTLMMLAAVALTLAMVFVRHDTLSALLLGLFVLAYAQPAGRTLYVSMFWLALLMELQGTWLGNWQWHAVVNYMLLHTLNPPVAAGALYCCLDALVNLLSPKPQTQSQSIAAPR